LSAVYRGKSLKFVFALRHINVFELFFELIM